MKWVGVHYALKLVTPPTVEPITYDEAKGFLRPADDTDALLITGLIARAREKVESDTALRLITQTWDVCLEGFPDDWIQPPLAPLQSVTSIVTVSRAGVSSTVDPVNYLVDAVSVPGRIALSDGGAWPADLRRLQPITVRCVVGFGASGQAVPQVLLGAMEQLIVHWYAANKQAVVPPLGATYRYDALIEAYRDPGVA